MLLTEEKEQRYRHSVATDIVAFTISSEVEENYRKLPEVTFNVLLIKRNMEPFAETWALPGGFLKEDETLEETARREFQEETGVSEGYFEQLFTFSEVDRDPRDRVISCSYLALIREKQTLCANTDASDAKWFQVSYKQLETEEEQQSYIYQLTVKNGEQVLQTRLRKKQVIKYNHLEEVMDILETDLAFDHGKILAMAIERLRGKLEYSQLAYELLPRAFSIRSLQKVHELILDKKLLDANFRRKIIPQLKESNESVTPVGHRTAKLYEVNIEWGKNYEE